jgi:hypothetical protein
MMMKYWKLNHKLGDIVAKALDLPFPEKAIGKLIIKLSSEERLDEEFLQVLENIR